MSVGAWLAATLGVLTGSILVGLIKIAAGSYSRRQYVKVLRAQNDAKAAAQAAKLKPVHLGRVK
jgi:hypothetical protein